MAIVNGSVTGTGADVDTTSLAMRTALYDQNGNPIFKLKNGNYATTDRVLPVGGLNDGQYRPIRVSRSGAQAIEKFTPLANLNFYTNALPPAWLAPTGTFTITFATTTGALLNAAATGAVSSHASLISMGNLPKYQKSLLVSRHRIKLTKGGTNGQADWGLFGNTAPGATVQTNGFVWLYGADQTLKPTYYFNGAVVAQGTDIASSIGSDTQYYVFDVILDDDWVTFVCQDPTTGAIISEQQINIQQGDGRIGLQPWFFCGARAFVTSSAANVGTATKLYVGDACAYMMDTDTYKPWSHIQSSNYQSGLVNPTASLTQLANYANSAAPATATLSNTAAGYNNLGGQFQFAATAGAETDYALFVHVVPTGVKLVVTGVSIDLFNTVVAVATTPTIFQWFIGDALAATLASNSFRATLGVQNLQVGAAVGAQAQQINASFQTPYTFHSGRVCHIGLKMPVGTATATEIFRGVVRVEGYFE